MDGESDGEGRPGRVSRAGSVWRPSPFLVKCIRGWTVGTRSPEQRGRDGDGRRRARWRCLEYGTVVIMECSLESSAAPQACALPSASFMTSG